MKKITYFIISGILFLSFACKNKSADKLPETQKAESITKSDKEKSDSVKEYWQRKIDSAANANK